MSTSTATYAPIGRGSGSEDTSTQLGSNRQKFVHFPSNPESICYTDTLSYASGGTRIDMPAFDPGADTTSLDQSSAGTPDSGFDDLDYHMLERPETHETCKKFIREIRTMAYLTQDFTQDVLKAPSDKAVGLLDELSWKIKPYLVKLDERLSKSEELIRKNLDQCRISDPRVNWLLLYHESIRKLRDQMTLMNTNIFEHMEEYLRLQVRGCVDSRIGQMKVDAGFKALKRIVQTLAEIEDVKLAGR